MHFDEIKEKGQKIMDKFLNLLIMFIISVTILAFSLAITVIMFKVIVNIFGYIYDSIFASIVLKIGHFIGRKIPCIKKFRIINMLWNNILNSEKCFRYQIPCVTYCFSYMVVLIIAPIFHYNDLINTIIVYVLYGLVYFLGMARRYKMDKKTYYMVLDNNMAFLKLSFMPIGFIITLFGFLFTITGMKIQEFNFNYVTDITTYISSVQINNISVEILLKIFFSIVILFLLFYIISLPFQVVSYFVIAVINYASNYREAYVELISNYKNLLKKLL